LTLSLRDSGSVDQLGVSRTQFLMTHPDYSADAELYSQMHKRMVRLKHGT